jgi:hypothetical protein
VNNLILMCRRHHRLVHEGGFDIEMDGGLARIRRREVPAGRLIGAGAPSRSRLPSEARSSGSAPPRTPSGALA